MTRTHVLPDRDFAELAAGFGDAGAVARLRAGQHSKTLLRVLALLRDAPADAAALRAGFDLLTRVQQVDPAAVASALTHPHVCAWAAQSIRLRQVASPAGTDRDVVGDAGEPAPLATVLGHLAGIAAGTALRAGVDFEITVPVRSGEVVLPGLGRALAGPAGGGATAGGATPESAQLRVAGSGGHLILDGEPVDPAASGPRWQPVHRLTAEADGLRLAVTLDDIDWHRDCHRLGATNRLDPATVRQWQEILAEAWRLLVRDHRTHAEAIAAGLTTLVPLRPDLVSRGVTATSMDAFGAVILSTPLDSVSLAASLVHEFQHAKLGALMDLVPLLHPGDQRRYYAPWRDDPRPVHGLLHGAYAFLGVADFWRVRRHHGDAHAGYAEFEFARWREQLIRVFGVLAGSGALTEVGSRFLDGMRATVRGWRTERVPPEVEIAARDAADDHRIAWRLRNLRCPSGPVARLAEAWSRGQPAPVLPAFEVRTDPGERVLRQHARLQLTVLRITEPERFRQLTTDPIRTDPAVSGASGADLALVGGRTAEAVEAYRQLIGDEPDTTDHWAGLALALRQWDDRDAGPLLRAPELILAVHRAVRAEGAPAPDPVSLAGWLASTVES